MSTPVDTILLEVSPGETRAAFLDRDGQLISLQIERMGEESQVGAICLGRVTRLEKATRLAFVEIGSGKTGVLNRAADLNEGEWLPVQVTRDAWGDKHAALTRRVSLTGRYLVLHPGEGGVRWPRGMAGRARRDLEDLVVGLAREGEGISVRSRLTADDGDSLAAEAARLRTLWQETQGHLTAPQRAMTLIPAPDLFERLLRDETPTGGIIVDDRRVVARLAEAAAERVPALADRIALHDGPQPLFAESDVEDQIDDALARHVALPRGGSLVIDPLEALTAIDVNMGGAGAGRTSDDAVMALNRTAAAEVARQVMVRNIAGLIVIDFISMRSKRHRRELVEAVRRAFAGDRVAVDVLGMTPAGLVEVTRQRRGRSLADLMFSAASREPVGKPAASACAALRAALRTLGAGRPVLICRPDIAAALKGPLAGALEETTRRLGQSLELREDAACRDFEMLWERPS